jgi:hypothetical protein
MSNTRLTTLAAGPMIAIGLTFGVAACGNPVQSTPTQGEVAECDEDDWEEGDEDCEGLSGPNAEDGDSDSLHKSKKKKVKKSSLFGGNDRKKKSSGFGGGSRSKPKR